MSLTVENWQFVPEPYVPTYSYVQKWWMPRKKIVGHKFYVCENSQTIYCSPKTYEMLLEDLKKNGFAEKDAARLIGKDKILDEMQRAQAEFTYKDRLFQAGVAFIVLATLVCVSTLLFQLWNGLRAAMH